MYRSKVTTKIKFSTVRQTDRLKTTCPSSFDSGTCKVHSENELETSMKYIKRRKLPPYKMLLNFE